MTRDDDHDADHAAAGDAAGRRGDPDPDPGLGRFVCDSLAVALDVDHRMPAAAYAIAYDEPTGRLLVERTADGAVYDATAVVPIRRAPGLHSIRVEPDGLERLADWLGWPARLAAAARRLRELQAEVAIDEAEFYASGRRRLTVHYGPAPDDPDERRRRPCGAGPAPTSPPSTSSAPPDPSPRGSTPATGRSTPTTTEARPMSQEERSRTGQRVRVAGDLFHPHLPDSADGAGVRVIYVGRGTPGLRASPFANPHRPGRDRAGRPCRTCGHLHDQVDAVTAYAHHLVQHPELVAAARRELVGADLACWCHPRLGPCHAGVLVLVASGAEPLDALAQVLHRD